LAPCGARRRAGAIPQRSPVVLRDRAKVLVVEDNTDSRQFLCDLLTQAHFECRAADSGIAALALADEFRPDVAVLDLGLPGMDGLQVARRLRSDPPQARMILIAPTGYGQAADRVAAREAGFDEHLVKPVQGEQLLSLLADMQGRAATATPAA